MHPITLCLVLAAAGAGARVAPGVERVENGGLLFTDNPAGVSGTDAGYSVAMGDRTLWLFGDVFLLSPTDPARRYIGGVSNCGLLVPRGHGLTPTRAYSFLTDPSTGVARQLLANEPDEDQHVRLWPAGGWYGDRDHRAYLYYMLVRTTGGGPFDFRLEGHGLAVADAPRPGEVAIRRLRTAAGSLLWWPAAGGPVFGAAVVTGGRRDGYVYVVGVREEAGAKRGLMARVPEGKVADLAAYTYFAGGEPADWSPDIRKAAPVAGLADFPSELSVSWNPYLKGYLAVHSVALSEKLRLCLADHPWGPYRTIAEIGSPHKAFSNAFCYAGKEHPELAEESGRTIYVTYVDNERYWLQMLRVTLKR